MTDNFKLDQDDFYHLPSDSRSAKEQFALYLKSKEIFDALPKSVKTKDPRADLHTLFKEVSLAETRNSALYRRKLDANESLSSFWLSKVRNFATILSVARKIPKFSGIEESKLSAIAKWSKDVSYLPAVSDALLQLGIILVYERAIPGMKLDGAVFILDSGNPVIGMTLRYPRIDNYWFTLMHELAHVAKHYDLLQNPILDDLDETPLDKIEKEADRLAGNSLISRSDWRSCPAKYDLSDKNVLSFASQIGVHPSIVAGRLRRELDRYNIFSDIVNKTNTREILFCDE